MDDKLYIIGNGFDLHHGLNTSYMHFRDYCRKCKPSMWTKLTELYGNSINEDKWWWQFEDMLSYVDYNSLVDSHNGQAIGGNKVENVLKNQLPIIFGNWILNITNKIQADSALNIDSNSLFFSFNYTLLLENVYHISHERIWHIHHSIKDVDRIVLGHDADDRKLFLQYINEKSRYNSISPGVIDNVRLNIAKGAKNVKGRISRHKYDIYTKYHNLKHIIAMGFSFNKIDMPYIKSIVNVNSIPDGIIWDIFYHIDSEKNSIAKMLAENDIHSEVPFRFVKW